jgi:thiol-disulfide isomerase/thioredoxin
MGSAGRIVRPALVLAALAAVGGLAFSAVLGGGRDPDRSPIVEPNSQASSPVEIRVGSVRHVYAGNAPQRLIIDTLLPVRPVRILWFEGRAAAPIAAYRTVTLDRAGGVVEFDAKLRSYRVLLALGARTAASVAPVGEDGFWIADSEGSVFQVDRGGAVIRSAAAGFDYPAVVADDQGGAWLVRSTSFFAYRLAAASDPLLVRIDSVGKATETLGSITVPEHVLLTELANSGHIALDDGTIYYAPFIRDEVVALALSGDTLWVAHRELPQSTGQPRFEIGADGPVIDYAPVNLGIRLGPDGRLYVLSIPGFTTSESRLDVLDPETGRLERSATLPTPLPTLAVDEEGRLHLLDPFRLLTGVAPNEREDFTPFELERLDGGTMNLDELRGRVVLVNFWASWCAPCRVEMPVLDSLRQSIEDSDFLFITMNEDIQTADAREFIEEYGFEFPVLLGHGRLKTKYHYVGLPYTVVLDREGRVVHRWVWFAGEEQIAAIRAVIRAELDREAGGGGHAGTDPGAGVE